MLRYVDIKEALRGLENYVDGFEVDVHGRVHIILRRDI